MSSEDQKEIGTADRMRDTWEREWVLLANWFWSDLLIPREVDLDSKKDERVEDDKGSFQVGKTSPMKYTE